MFTLSTSIELPISHCLYRGAYSGLCCGNVYRDARDDGKKERYELGDKVLPILHGHNYTVSISIDSNKLNQDEMVVDFKLLKKIIHSYFDQYDHSMILTPDNPLVEVYKKNFEENGIDFNRSRLFVWNKNPTAEVMAKYWHSELFERFSAANLQIERLKVTVEETSNNSASYESTGNC